MIDFSQKKLLCGIQKNHRGLLKGIGEMYLNNIFLV
jgi:hypothetical protein